MDINFSRVVDGTNVEYVTSADPRASFGNKKLANIFEIKFLTKTKENDTFNTRGGDALSILGAHYNSGDLQSMGALVTTMIDNTVEEMIADQSGLNVPTTEKIIDAKLTNISGDGKTIEVDIKLIPEEYNTQDQILTFFL